MEKLTIAQQISRLMSNDYNVTFKAEGDIVKCSVFHNKTRLGTTGTGNTIEKSLNFAYERIDKIIEENQK